MSSNSNAPTAPSDYYMCSQAECQERQSSGEISIFESKWPPPSADTPRSSSLQRGLKSRRMVHPRHAMTKYRRSAAGVDTKNRTPPRSLQQLECCLDQLEYILCHQQQPNTNGKPFPKQTLTGTVSFVEDRIRAIQVDMVVSQQPSATLQYRVAKCHILILYLLGQQQVKTLYEAKFGRQALTTALTNYWDDPHRTLIQDDEMLTFLALQQLCQYYQGGCADESTLSFVLGYYRRNASGQHQLADFSKFQWALHLVHLAVMSRPRSILRQLVELGQTNKVGASFAILCRCCLAPIVDTLRVQTLDQANKSYMKGEKVSTKEMARLLYMSTAEDAGDFCQTMAGLTRNQDGDDDKIVFKVGPVQQSKNLGQVRQDEFVFGSYFGSWNAATLPQKDAWDDLEPSASPVSVVGNDGDKDVTSYGEAVTDSEGVLIPPSMLLFRILRGDEKL